MYIHLFCRTLRIFATIRAYFRFQLLFLKVFFIPILKVNFVNRSGLKPARPLRFIIIYRLKYSIHVAYGVLQRYLYSSLQGVKNLALDNQYVKPFFGSTLV